MPRVIFKCPYLKGGSERAASHLHNYVRYMATREGAQHMAIGHEQLPATEEQRKMVAQLLREFPLSRGLFEYEDYQTAPTRGNASEFITRALEDNYDQIAKRDNYVSYIASRPRAQRAGAHALFTGSDAPLVLSQIAAEVAHHPGNVWLPIISLRREDAARLGYDDAGQWKNLIAGYAMEMAEATLKELNRQTSGDIILKVKKTTVSSIEAKATIGNRPVYDISLWEVKNGKETKLSNLNGKTISIAIPYTPAKNEQPGNLYAVSVDGNGKPQWITKSSYDADQKAVIFELIQPGVYGVGYDAKMPAFTDIENHWAKDNILFVVSRGLLNGTSETTFSPNTGMTRGMFVTALGRLAGVDPADYQSGKFTDVKADAYYAPYVNWAAKTGIVSGTTDTTFAPDTNINREQMAVIMKNYAAKLGYTVPKALEAVTFADNASISSWAKEAVKSMQQAGILAGKTNNRFDPAGTATRAEVATVLRRFVEIVIDPQTANGWQ